MKQAYQWLILKMRRLSLVVVQSNCDQLENQTIPTFHLHIFFSLTRELLISLRSRFNYMLVFKKNIVYNATFRTNFFTELEHVSSILNLPFEHIISEHLPAPTHLYFKFCSPWFKFPLPAYNLPELLCTSKKCSCCLVFQYRYFSFILEPMLNVF